MYSKQIFHISLAKILEAGNKTVLQPCEPITSYGKDIPLLRKIIRIVLFIILFNCLRLLPADRNIT